MWSILTSNLKLTLIFSIILISAFGAIFIYVTILQKNQKHALETQQSQLIAQCQKAQQVTENANAKLEQDRDAISKRLNTLLVRHPSKCLLASKPSNQANSGTGHAGPNGINSDALRGYAATCESYRSELLTYIDFVDKERR